jgi:hypothetical protein
MTSALNHPVRCLPVDGGKTGDVVIDVKVMTWNHVNAWNTLVQPLIDNTYMHSSPHVEERRVRADVGWDWSLNYAMALIHNAARLLPANMSGPARAFTVVVGPDNEEIPIGMLTVVPEFYCRIGGTAAKRAFVWYLADAPREFYTRVLHVAPVKGVASVLIDSAIQSGLDAGGSGATLLHADPKGGAKLQDFYMEKCGMQRVHMQEHAISALRRTNINQYFYLDTSAAKQYSARLNHRR